MEILLRNLPDITVQAKILAQQGKIEEACDLIANGIAELLISIKKETVPESILKRLQGVSDTVDQIRKNHSISQLGLIIGRLEESYIDL